MKRTTPPLRLLVLLDLSVARAEVEAAFHNHIMIMLTQPTVYSAAGNFEIVYDLELPRKFFS